MKTRDYDKVLQWPGFAIRILGNRGGCEYTTREMICWVKCGRGDGAKLVKAIRKRIREIERG